MNFRLFRIMVAYALFSVPEIAIWVGLLIFLYDRGGASAAGLIGGLSLVPAILISPLVSTFGDRMPRGQAIFIGCGHGASLLGRGLGLGGRCPDLRRCAGL